MSRRNPNGLRIGILCRQPSHVLLRFSDHGLHKRLHDSRDGFTRHAHSATGLPAVFDQLVYFGSQIVSGRGDDDLVFRNSHLRTAPTLAAFTFAHLARCAAAILSSPARVNLGLRRIVTELVDGWPRPTGRSPRAFMAVRTLIRCVSSLLSSVERALRICCMFMLRCYQNPQRLTSFVQRHRGPVRAERSVDRWGGFGTLPSLSFSPFSWRSVSALGRESTLERIPCTWLLRN
jgi:hypothetical protein